MVNYEIRIFTISSHNQPSHLRNWSKLHLESILWDERLWDEMVRWDGRWDEMVDEIVDEMVDDETEIMIT